MNLYKTRSFARIAAKVGITEAMLKKTAEEISQGLIHADLGGNVFKQRVAPPERGQRGGGHIVVVIRPREDRYIFLHCYLKKDQENIGPGEENAFLELGRIFSDLTEEDIKAAALSGLLEEML
ncbi:MAG: type II toxin-antitoxin system RelE/ParE family toxin [Candidatus Adiutrix sp.]|jgi:hypothetical protein|nr:type II toxin-antitoxin system RelE/ParE family toxin [Candidatus Adiutrix sp.]